MHSRKGAGAEGQRRGRREEGRENPKGPEGWEGGRALDGNRCYLRRCPRAAVELALAALALEPAAPPGALGHPGTALAGAPRLAPSSRPRRRVAWSPAARAGHDAPVAGGRLGSECESEWVGPGVAGGEVRRGGACPGRRSAGAGQGAVWLRNGSRQRRGVPGAGWARRIAKACGLAPTAERGGERAQEEGSSLKAEGEQRRGKHQEPRAGCRQEADVS